MGMSTSVMAFISPEDNTYRKHLKVLEACIEAGISKLPEETAEYFNAEYPEEYLKEEKLEVQIPQTEWSDGNMSNGYEVLVSDIPEGTHKIRFVNSW